MAGDPRNQHKSIAYTAKALQEIQRQYFQKVLRVLRAHENRITRIEKHNKIEPSDKELFDLSNEVEEK